MSIIKCVRQTINDLKNAGLPTDELQRKIDEILQEQPTQEPVEKAKELAKAMLGHEVIKKLTAEEFIARSREIHGNKYGYGKVRYVNNKTKVTITCPEHGDFEQRPDNHLKGNGCRACSIDARAASRSHTTEEFITRSREIHGNKYGYGKVRYVNNKTKVTITCPEHGDFDQAPDNHLSGMGCRACSIDACSASLPHSTEKFVARSREIHGNKYSYSKVRYVNVMNKVTITCPEHGDFEQRPNSHLSGVGCPACAVTGYNTTKQGYVYFLLDMGEHSRIKVGISNIPKKRLKGLKRSTPFPFKKIAVVPVPGEIAPMLESMAHASLSSAGLTGFDGATEWRNYKGDVVDMLINKCKEFEYYE